MTDPNTKYMPAVRAFKRFLICDYKTYTGIGGIVLGQEGKVHMDVTFHKGREEDPSIRMRLVGDEGGDEDTWFSLDGGLERLKEIVSQIEGIRDRLNANQEAEEDESKLFNLNTQTGRFRSDRPNESNRPQADRKVK